MYFGALTDVPGVKVGHTEDNKGGTGVTVVLPPKNSCGAVDVRGGAPGTRETDLLRPVNMVETVHAIVLSGGSAYGLKAASGVMDALEKDGIGMDVGIGLVPIVPQAVIFDLDYKDPKVRPDEKMGYEAYNNASNEVSQGSLGAGCGATVGKILGNEYAMKSGVGTASIKLDELIVSALVCVNAFGDIYDAETGEQLAGVQKEGEFLKTENYIHLLQPDLSSQVGKNTTIGVVCTNAKLNKTELTKVASMSHNGYARSIHPVHTQFDGDTIFTLSCGKILSNVNVVGTLAARVMSRAIANVFFNLK